MKLNCIVVDDEPVARDLLERYILDVPALELRALCKNAFEASEALMEYSVDLIFLDISMPRLSGMQFYRSLANPPAVIFTTAYPEYALEGFEVDAVDYLLKPFSFERFYQAVSRVLDRRRSKPQTAGDSYILLRCDKRIHRVGLSEVRMLEGLGDYVKVHLPGAVLIVHDTLKNLLEGLPGMFVQVHRSWVVSLRHVNYIEGNTVIMGDDEVPIGLKFREDFLRQFGDRGKAPLPGKRRDANRGPAD